jgi:hypothetical protein
MTSPVPSAINDRGDVVGFYADSGWNLDGFLLRDGAYTTFDAPGGTATLPFDINDRGQIVGFSSVPVSGDLFVLPTASSSATGSVHRSPRSPSRARR